MQLKNPLLVTRRAVQLMSANEVGEGNVFTGICHSV